MQLVGLATAAWLPSCRGRCLVWRRPSGSDHRTGRRVERHDSVVVLVSLVLAFHGDGLLAAVVTKSADVRAFVVSEDVAPTG